MSNLCIVPLIKIALKHPNGRIAQATFNLISDMADEERASSHTLKNASEQSNYWRSSLAVMKYASEGMRVDHYLLSLSNKTSNLNVELNPYFSDLGEERLNQIEGLLRTATKSKKKPTLTVSEQSAIIQDPKANPKARKSAFNAIFKALGKEGASIKKAWSDNLKKKRKVSFKTSKGTEREKEVSLKTIAGFSKVKNPSLKDAYQKIWQKEYEGYIKTVVSMAENLDKKDAPPKNMVDYSKGKMDELDKKVNPKPKSKGTKDYDKADQGLVDYQKSMYEDLFSDDPKSRKDYEKVLNEAEMAIKYNEELDEQSREDEVTPNGEAEIALKELLKEYNNKWQSMYEND